MSVALAVPYLRPGLSWDQLSEKQKLFVTQIKLGHDRALAARATRTTPETQTPGSEVRPVVSRAASEMLERALRRKILDKKIDRAAREQVEKEAAATRKVVLTSAADIKPRPTKWLWRDKGEGRLPLGELALIAGRESIGKSSVAYERIARITRGQLEGEFFGTPRNVIVAATEDAWDHTIVPRLMATGADLTRVFQIKVRIADQGTFALSLPDDLLALREAIVETEAALVLFDPLISRLSKRLDTHKDAEVRTGLEPLVQIANDTTCSFLGIIHVNKGSSKDPLTTIMGSRAFAAVSRAVFYVVVNPDNPKQKLFGQPKNNLGKDGDDLPTLTFEIKGATIATDEGPAETSRVAWTGTTDLTVNEVVAESADKGGRAVADAKDWLAEHMASLPGKQAFSKEIKAAAKKAGFKDRTLKRACAALKLVVQGVGVPRQTTWALPGTPVQGELPEEEEL